MDAPETAQADLALLRRGLWLVFWSFPFLILDFAVNGLDLLPDVIGGGMAMLGTWWIMASVPTPGPALPWALAGASAKTLVALLALAGASTWALDLVLNGVAAVGDVGLCWGLARLVTTLGWRDLSVLFGRCGWAVLVYHVLGTAIVLGVMASGPPESGEWMIPALVVGAAIIIFEMVLLARTARRVWRQPTWPRP